MRALALVACAMALACGGRGPELTEDGRIILHYWEKWVGTEPGSEGAAIREIVDAYNAQSDRWFVEYSEGGALMDQKLLVAIAGGNPPDISGYWNDRLPGFVLNGALEPLDRFIEADPDIDLDDYLPSVLRCCQFEDFTWGLPLTPATLALFYNRDHFREAGLDPDRPPRTIAELDEIARRLTIWNEDHTEIVQLGFSPDIPGWWNNLWPIWFGGDFWDGDRTITVDSPECLACFEWIAAYEDEYTLRELDRFKAAADNFDSPRWPLFSDRLSMVIQGTWTTNFIGRHAPDLDWGVAPFPAVSEDLGDISFMQCDILVIPRGCPNPEGAWDFIRFTQRPENLERLNIAHHKFSPLREVSDSFYENHPNPQIDLFRDLAMSESVYIAPPLAAFNELQAELWQVFYAVLKADADPREELAEARVTMQRMLDRTVRQWDRIADERRRQWAQR
jgi:ABC-type glycerol-3-phosphate transport system substrate-binding protein